jgi:selenocysteine-specific elongation factor
MSDHLSIGVIGHVDHGKTTLVKALTGTETDRLAEEKRRGLTIVLGFAYRQTPMGMIDFIDAPGHADFVRTMISGATGIEAALIVVAANEGIMPQTVEHIRIAALLGIKRAVVALSKTDLATPDDIVGSSVAVRDFLMDSGFDDPLIVPVSAQDGTGIEALVGALEGLFQDRSPRPESDGFYLPFDRVFTVQGFGTVATGTLRGGIMRGEDLGEILPTGDTARVRGLEVHGQTVEMARPGQRVAVNIRTDATLNRGQALASTGLMQPASYWDAHLRLTGDNDRPLKNGTPVRVLHGTTETQATIRLLDRDRMLPGETADVQFRLKVPAAAWDQDHFVVRTISPLATIGGGRFLNTRARRRKRFDDATMAQLQAVGGTDVGQAVVAHVAQAGLSGVPMAELEQRFSASGDDLQAMLRVANCHIAADHTVFDDGVIREAGADVVAAVGQFHADQPSRLGIGQPELVEAHTLGAAAAQIVFGTLVDAGEIQLGQGLVSLPGFDPLAALGEAKRAYLDQLETRIRDDAMTPPSMGEIVADNSRDKGLAELLIEVGRVVPLYDHKRTNLFLFHHGAIDEAVVALQQAFAGGVEFRAGEAREVLNSTRKYMIPFLTYLDRQNITRRKDDLRQIVEH